jgi:methylase of polypeptide subunit release factors
VLEIGVGSGINTIYALKQGANHVTTLDVNPRTSELTRRNMELNGIDPSQVDLLLNDSFDLTDLFKPVEGEKFDYIVTNPPFEYGRVDEDDALRNSASGLDGLDMIREIFSQIDTYLTDTGHMQMVFFAPGTSEGPTSLIEAASRLEGKVEIIYKANPMKTADFVKINLGKEMDIPTEHEYYWMGMLHYTRGQDGLSVRAGEEEKNWHLPLYSDVPMMHKHSKIDEVYQDTKKLPVNLSVAKKEER